MKSDVVSLVLFSLACILFLTPPISPGPGFQTSLIYSLCCIFCVNIYQKASKWSEKLFYEVRSGFLMTVPVTTKHSQWGDRNVNFRDMVAFAFEMLLFSNLTAPELVIGRALFPCTPRVPAVLSILPGAFDHKWIQILCLINHLQSGCWLWPY